MLKIGEFSQLARVSVRTLRHYDDLGLLRPAEIDRFTDYRYYRVDQLLRLNRILALKDLGFSLTAIAGLIEDDLPVEQLRGMLTLRRAQLADEIRDSQAQLARVEARLREIEQAPPAYDVVLKPVEARTIVSLRALIPTLDQMETLRCALYESLYERLTLDRVPPAGSELAVYHLDEYAEHDIDMEAAVVLPVSRDLARRGLTVRELAAAPLVAATVHRGSFIDVTQAIQALFYWVGSNGYTADGPLREWHLFGREIDLAGPDFNDVIIEVQLPVAPAGLQPTPDR